MTAGLQPSVSGINTAAGQIVLNARAALQQIIFFNDYLLFLGQEGLVTLGFDSTDATLLLAVFANLAAVANTCMGAAYTGPTLPFNFMAQSIPFWGGQ